MKRIIIFSILYLFIVSAGISKAESAATKSDSLIKGTGSVIYYYASDGFRYVFPDDKTFGSWFSDFKNVITVSDSELANIPLKGNVTYRPGVRMIKVKTNPKVYAVDKGGKLRWIENEEIAKKLYGDDWNKKIDDVSDVFFMNYIEGDSIKNTNDYNPAAVVEEVKTINKEKGIVESISTLQGTTKVGDQTSIDSSKALVTNWCAKNFHVENNLCVCDEGYYFSNYSCISHTNDCKSTYGDNVYGTKTIDNKVGYSSCYCAEGYQWNLNKTKCIKKCPPNSLPGMPSQGNEEKCFCDSGYDVDPVTQGCKKSLIKEVTRPTTDLNNYQEFNPGESDEQRRIEQLKQKELFQEMQQQQQMTDSDYLYKRNESYIKTRQYENRKGLRTFEEAENLKYRGPGTICPFGGC